MSNRSICFQKKDQLERTQSFGLRCYAWIITVCSCLVSMLCFQGVVGVAHTVGSAVNEQQPIFEFASKQTTIPMAELQRQVDRLPAGASFEVPPGIYKGTLLVDRPLHLKGSAAVVLLADDDEPDDTVRITADDVSLEQLRIVQPSRSEVAAVYVEGSHSHLRDLELVSAAYGVQIRGGEAHTLQNNRIRAPSTAEWTTLAIAGKEANGRNGIDMHHASRNVIKGNEIERMGDGVYLEDTHDTAVQHNRITLARYAIHCMYTNRIQIVANEGERNVTGAMIMQAQAIEVERNRFLKQSEHVNAQGILLFDVQQSTVQFNRLEGNRVGLYLERSERNHIHDNEWLSNFVALQMVRSDGNWIEHNRFAMNVVDAQGDRSSGNKLIGNRWEDFHGIDVNGDGTSEMAYRISPFFQKLSDQWPMFQLFFRAPGMGFLEQMSVPSRSEWMVDSAPLMANIASLQPPEQRAKAERRVFIPALLLVGLSGLLFWMMGRRRR